MTISRGTWIVVLLLAIDVWAGPRTPVLRLQPDALSYAVKLKHSSAPCKWSYDGHLHNQLERAAVAEALTYVAVPRIIYFARKVAPSTLSFTYSTSGLSGISMKLDPVYVSAEMRQGQWHEIDQCRDYVIPWNIEKKVRDAAISSANAANCAKHLTPELSKYLHIKVVNGKCVYGSDVIVQEPKQPYDSWYAHVYGLLVTSKTAPTSKPDLEEVEAIDATHRAHLISQGVDLAHQKLEALADDESEHRLFRLGAFLPDCDPGWTSEQCARWDAIKHTKHVAWGNSVKAGNQFAAEQDKIDHNLSHLCKNIGADTRLFVRFSCPAGRGFTGNMDRCPSMTCIQALATLN